MNKEFVPYELAVKLKALGFDEPCLCSWNFYTNELNFNGQPSTFSSEDVIQLPTFSQAFRWFREKYGLYGIPQEYTLDNFSYQIKSNREGAITLKVYGGYPLNYITYEEAELACLDKLIEIVESKSE
jgi:hypothetical protein